MKKSILTLSLAFMLLLCGCSSVQNTVDMSMTEQTSESALTDITDNTYEDIEGRTIKRYNKQYFAFSDSTYAIDTDLPDDWVLKKESGGSYKIMRDGNNVGVILKGESQDTDIWKSVHSENNRDGELSSSLDIEQNVIDTKSVFRYRFTFSYTEQSRTNKFTLITDYAELSRFSAQKLLYSRIINTEFETGTGVLKHIGELANPNLLILGNSFIFRSDIAPILKEMCDVNNKALHVSGQAKGYATVDTYINDSAIMQSIRNGDYDAVFICGFYSSGEVSNLGVLKSACDASGTELVIFPAHNENTSVISTACSTYKGLVCLNWKAELDSLISKGVNRWDLCHDDEHDHSTALAGYVGAHMIYRALFDELPTADMKNNIDQSYVDAILGDYVSTGTVKEFDRSKVIYL